MTAQLNLHDAEPIPAHARADIDRLLASGALFRYGPGETSPVAALERAFAEMMEMPFALAVNSCSSALFLALKSLGVGPGDRVLIPAFTFTAVPSAVVHAGAEPVLVEVGDTFRLDLADFEEKLAAGAQAVLLSHMRGHTSDMDAILALCADHEVPLIEDAAHSLGTRWDGNRIGTLGRVGCFSFQSFKMMNAGEGGMLVTRDPDVLAQAVIMSGAYETNWRKHPGVGEEVARWQKALPVFNMRMNNLSAAILRPQIPEVARRVRDGRANHDYLGARLNASPWLEVPQPLGPEVRAPDSIQFMLRGFADDAEAQAFLDAAEARGVPVQIFGLSADNARAFWNWEFLKPQAGLPRTRAMLMRACDLRLPAWLTRAELDGIADALLTALHTVKSPSHRRIA